jgi:flagellar basal-body rod protein FlgC
MSLFSILDVSAAGMDVQQARLEVAALNLANAQTTASKDGVGYKPLTVVVRSSAIEPSVLRAAAATTSALPRPVIADVVQQDVAARLVYEPGHPDADERGFVSMPGVDPIGSMMDLIAISRGYEANLRAFDVTRTLLQRALDIGSGR